MNSVALGGKSGSFDWIWRKHFSLKTSLALASCTERLFSLHLWRMTQQDLTGQTSERVSLNSVLTTLWTGSWNRHNQRFLPSSNHSWISLIYLFMLLLNVVIIVILFSNSLQRSLSIHLVTLAADLWTSLKFIKFFLKCR